KRAAARAIVDPQPGDVQPADAAAFMFGTLYLGPDGQPGGGDDVDWRNDADGVTTTGLDVQPADTPASVKTPDPEQTTGVDLWIGGLGELTNQNGGLLGSTFNYVFQ